jgi:hypothetical protein
MIKGSRGSATGEAGLQTPHSLVCGLEIAFSGLEMRLAGDKLWSGDPIHPEPPQPAISDSCFVIHFSFLVSSI